MGRIANRRLRPIGCRVTGASPAFLHEWMAELHPVFGYGAHDDPSKVEKFWRTGEGMRVNPDMKNNIGTSNIS